MLNKKELRRFVLDNAVRYGGKADTKSVLGNLISKYPEVKKDIKKFIKELNGLIKEVNSISLEEQRKELNKLGEIKKEKKERRVFDFLNIKKGEKVITAFPPGPEKYPHIGHAKSFLLNYLLAKEYKGKFYLRFEDTNPNLVKKEFYKIMEEDFKWLGVKWDKLQYASDYMDLFYDFGEKLIKDDKAYVCYCSPETIKYNRRKKLSCDCRFVDSKDNLVNWKNFFKAEKGSSIIRLKGNMKSNNALVRDPSIFRINDSSHPRTKKKYRVWPTYEFQNSIMDGYFKVTHRLRSKEFELMAEVQKYIQKLLKLQLTKTYEMARFNMKGTLSSGRVIREKIETKELIGWDDPRLTTLVALRKRGFTPEAIKDFVISTGISKTESEVTWDDLIVKNRRIIDFDANRYFFIEDKKKKKIKIKGFKGKIVKIPLHPTNQGRGTRTLKVKNEFYIEDALKKGKNYRFMHLFNFKNNEYVSEEFDKKLNAQLIHWLPVSKDLVKVKVLMDNARYVEGLAEPDVKKLKVGDIIQFERKFFCRLNKKGKVMEFIYTHK